MDRLNIRTKNRKFETAKDLYGIFFEDINRAGDGGMDRLQLTGQIF